MEKYELTILMPCLNEERTVAAAVHMAQGYIDKHHLNAQVIVVDNGSTDHSRQLAKEAGARVVRASKKGYGAALRAGLAVCESKYTIYGDCDLSYDFAHLNRMLSLLRKGYDMVAGNRYAGGIRKGAMSFSHRYIGVPILSLCGRLVYGVKLRDFHCGLRGVSMEAYRCVEAGLVCEGMDFASEIIGVFASYGLSIAEIPVPLYCDGRKAKSHLRSIPDGIAHMQVIGRDWVRRRKK